jgi:PAS domain S-box-containing protein
MYQIIDELRKHITVLSSFFQKPEAWFFRLSAIFVVGFIALTCIALASYWVNLGFETTAFAYLAAMAALSTTADLRLSALFSILSLIYLKLMLVEPRLTFQVENTRDLVALASFSATSFAITALVHRAYRLLRAENEKARLLDLISEAIFVHDLRGAITYCNQSAEKLYGWKRDEMIGQRELDILRTTGPTAQHGEPRLSPTNIEQINHRLLATGRLEGEAIDTSRDGSKIITLTHWSVLRDEVGDLTGVLSTKVDITEKKRTEDALRRIQSVYLDEAQKLSLTGSFGWNVSTGEIFWSEQSFRIFGYDRKIRPTMEMILNRVHPEDANAVQGMIERAAAERRAFDFELRLQMPDLSVKALHIVAHVVANEPGKLEFAGAFMDITRHKQAYAALEQSEQRYRDLFRNVPIALCQFDTGNLVELFSGLPVQGVADVSLYLDAHPGFLLRAMEAVIVVEINEQTIRLLGARDAGDIVGKSITPYYRSSPHTFRRSLESWFRGEPFFAEETQLTTLDGRVIDVFLNVSRMGPPTGSGVSVASMVDLTDRARAQKMLQQADAEFARAARIAMLGELTASIAHEVNQPLAAVAVNAEAARSWLERSEPNVAEARDLMDRIAAQAQRAADTIERIRGMAARGSAKRTPLLVRDLVTEATVLLRHEIQSNNVALVLDFSGPPTHVIGDRTELHQVIVNLALNAIQAMVQTEKVQRVLMIGVERPAPDRVLCAIDDTGPGIGPQHFDRVFDSFFTTKEKGTGIGLSISRRIIEAHGGTLKADHISKLGGARFFFTLPTVVGALDHAPLAAEVAAMAPKV